MTLHFHWSHAPRWLTHAPFNRATTLVLGIIAVSVLFVALRVIDAAVSGGQATGTVPAASGAAAPTMMVTDPGGEAAAALDANLIDVPDATAEAVSL